MKSFEEWTADIAADSDDTLLPEWHIELIDYNQDIMDEPHNWVFPCCICERDSEICCEPEEFDPDMHYCGGSPSCCP